LTYPYESKDVQKLADFQNELLLRAKLRDPTDEMLGATLQPIDDTLRAQLGIPPGQGLLIVSIANHGPCAQAGLKLNDILLSLAGQPLGAAEDLTKQLKAAGDATVPLKILRTGKPLTIQIRPIYRVTLGPVAESKAEYYIGVSIDPVDDAMRAQLPLPEGQGVVVKEVTSGSPAEKAGVKQHDIILEMGGRPIDSPQTLASSVQSIQDKPTTLKVLRAGKVLTIPVTPAQRQVEPSPTTKGDVRWWLLQQAVPGSTPLNLLATPNLEAQAPALGGAEDLRHRLDRVDQELKALRAAVEKLNEALRSDKPAKRD
jgi:serine protease Do